MLRKVRGFAGFESLLRRALTLAALALVVPVACGDSEDDPPDTDDGAPSRGGTGLTGSGGTSGKGGSSGSGGMGGEGGEGSTDGHPPEVTIVSPEALDDPGDGPVLVGSEVEVVCKAVQSSASGSEPVNPSTVVIEMLDADGEPVGAPEVAPPGAEDDEFIKTFVLTAVPNGVVSFRCTASAGTDQGPTGSATISTFVDHGPAIVIETPADNSVYPQQGVVRFEFTVEPDPLTDDDDEAAVESVTLLVADKEIDDVVAEGGGVFTADVDFTDDLLFGAALEGLTPVEVRATNRRSDPGPVTGTAGHLFKVDGSGPVITITSPPNQVVKGGPVTLVFNVSDAISDVDVASVTVSVQTDDYPYMESSPAWTGPAGTEFTFTFDSRQIPDSVVKSTITVSAKDEADNLAPPATLLLYLDNQPPIVDLDPPTIREKTGSQTAFCSLPFDPLGTSPNDLSDVHETIRFPRVFVWDETNDISDATPRFAGTDQVSVYLYLQTDPTEPVIMGPPDDPQAVCDRINPALLAPSSPKLHMARVPQEGTAWYGRESDDTTPDPPMPSYCTYQNTPIPPSLLCENQTSDIPRVTQHGLIDDEPVVFGNGSPEDDPACTGDQWEIQGWADEGWLCLAAIASDTEGNTAVSRPIRVCYDDLRTSAQPSCLNHQNPPSCTDGCALPRRFLDRGPTARINNISN